MIASLPPAAPGHDKGSTPAPAEVDLGGLTFGDVLSALNPLQYLPVVGTIYREVTGDSVSPALRIAVSGASSILLGGPIGLAATMIGAVANEVAQGDAAAPGATQVAAHYLHAAWLA